MTPLKPIERPSTALTGSQLSKCLSGGSSALWKTSHQAEEHPLVHQRDTMTGNLRHL